ncbi:hypothetical protein AA3271_1658 [Gluconobacter japonicus NBRC 3271]|nr:hypothetical protein AA3271_1658 [Gluconobacter japonicus NBRC 3271]
MQMPGENNGKTIRPRQKLPGCFRVKLFEAFFSKIAGATERDCSEPGGNPTLRILKRDADPFEIWLTVLFRKTADKINPLINEGAWKINPQGTVMVSPDHDDLEMPQPVSGVCYEGIESLLCRDGRVRHVIQVPCDKQNVTGLFFEFIQKPVKKSIVFCLTRVT